MKFSEPQRSSMQPEDRAFIADMLDEADAIAGFVSGRSRRDLEEDRMLYYAVLRAIEVMGEAASRVSEGTRAESPDIPWKLVVATRNRLIHGYATIDRDTVWRTATQDVPQIVPGLRRLVTLGSER